MFVLKDIVSCSRSFPSLNQRRYGSRQCLFNINGFSGAIVPRFGIAIAQFERVSHLWIAAVNALVAL